jgi:uncharacterized membrane-anchored protein YhcB (DUF1043 family)
MDLSSIDYIQMAIGFLIGLLLGLIIIKIFLKSKTPHKIAASSDNKLKLENEVLSDKVKQLSAKITTLEKALEIATK